MELALGVRRSRLRWISPLALAIAAWAALPAAVDADSGPGLVVNGNFVDRENWLSWFANDNGSLIPWAQANRYCAERDFGNHWRLPTPEEMKALMAKDRKFPGLVWLVGEPKPDLALIRVSRDRVWTSNSAVLFRLRGRFAGPAAAHPKKPSAVALCVETER
jgi:hypothetical protein